MNNLSIPKHWSPHQALAVLDFLEELHRALWEAYEQPVVDILVNQTNEPPDNTTSDYDFTDDDDIPF